MKLTVKQFSSIKDISAKHWNSLNVDKNPFTSHAFLAALENSGSVSIEKGWDSAHLGWFDVNNQLQAVLPLYFKTHSYGEYMFDWAWADGISRAGFRYYPKAVASIPFSPVPGQRLLLSEKLRKNSEVINQLITQLLNHLKEQDISNFQCLFIEQSETEHWQKAGAMIRQGYQFSWYNNHYTDFDDFLSKLRSKDRKKIKRERRQVDSANLTIRVLEGEQIEDSHWAFFIQCYQQTYYKRSGHQGYLNLKFFELIRQQLSEHLIIVCAFKEEQPIAASLFIRGNDILYGRYWGAMEEVDGLHFECCYYQAINYCIEHKIACLQPGTQGDYKRRRGFIPERVYGAYSFKDAHLQQSIQRYLSEETELMEQQFKQWAKSSPYKVD